MLHDTKKLDDRTLVLFVGHGGTLGGHLVVENPDDKSLYHLSQLFPEGMRLLVSA